MYRKTKKKKKKKNRKKNKNNKDNTHIDGGGVKSNAVTREEHRREDIWGEGKGVVIKFGEKRHHER